MSAGTSSTKPTIAFIGPTGGCCSTALTLALKNGYQCSALARTPSSLRRLLLSNSVPKKTLENNLTIIQGDIRNTTAVSSVLAPKGAIVDTIVSGVGAVFSFSLSGPRPDFTVCEAASKSITTALSQLRQSNGSTYKAPHLIAISTTGITSGPRDVPLLNVPLYKVALHTPHVDKELMEAIFAQAAADNTLDLTIMRPSLLTSGATLGRNSLKVGTEKQPALGYRVSRGDVGTWIFEELIDGGAQTRKRWMGQKVTITY